MLPVEFLLVAAAEADAAEAWYGERNPLAAEAFRSELGRVVGSVREGPLRWPSYLAGTRRRRFQWFPFSLIYRVEAQRIVVIAVAHNRRKPGYWTERFA